MGLSNIKLGTAKNVRTILRLDPYPCDHLKHWPCVEHLPAKGLQSQLVAWGLLGENMHLSGPVK